MPFPDTSSIPDTLLALPGHCGPVSAWMVLAYFSLDVPAVAVVQACRHSAETGTFMIALAVALHDAGLRTVFYTDPDERPHAIEQRCYRLARARGIPIRPALGVEQALAQINSAQIGIVCYGTPEGEGHISPLIGREDDAVLLPYHAGGRLDVETFARRWRAPEILRQLILVSKKL